MSVSYNVTYVRKYNNYHKHLAGKVSSCERKERLCNTAVIDNLNHTNKNCLDITRLSDNSEISLYKTDIKGKETVLDIFKRNMV